ncbi:hypothetical protein Q8W71_32450 [Methylobacterium sp. NEAU 140]|uniref:hypothetical protein n=1 Tax=Methylobacterium sp. NEAU 140 TaxID=3064945 RepID=UPI002735913C|nr:hypothetical protein [Methylobacterium sp. NEAU 140]MDP4027276.1 hypothetical protein [Methylobacterium sp. NEAU 140]
MTRRDTNFAQNCLVRVDRSAHHQPAATPVSHPDCRSALIQIVALQVASAGEWPDGLIALKKKAVRRENCIALPSGVPFRIGVSPDEALRASMRTDLKRPGLWSLSNSSMITGRLSGPMAWRMPASELSPVVAMASGVSSAVASRCSVLLPAFGGP